MNEVEQIEALALEICKQDFIKPDAICYHGWKIVKAVDIREYEATGFVMEHFT